MAKTLADMTTEEHECCVGMWCDAHVAGKTLLEVIGAVEGDWVTLVDPNGGRTYQLEGIPAKDVHPRFDLPRAWNPDGTPTEPHPHSDRHGGTMTPTPSDMPHQVMQSVRDEYRAEFTETYGRAIGDVTEIHAHMLAATDDEQAAAILTLAVIMATPEDE